MISPETGEAIRLDDEIGPMLEDGRGGLVVLLGGPGSGKTTALQHLAAIMPPWARGRVRLLEVLDPTAIAVAGPDPFVILTLDSHQAAGPAYVKVMQGYTGHELAALDSLLADRKPCHYRLAPWDQDDAIEYLLATDRDACASVMGRLGRSGDFAFLEGIPELCTIVLDRMARTSRSATCARRLRAEPAARLDGLSIPRERIEDLCIDALRQAGAAEWSSVAAERTGRDRRGEHLARLIRHRPAALLLAADRIAFLVACGRLEPVLTKDYPRELVRGVARQIAFNTAASRHLNGWIKGNQSGIQPLAASLLHAVDPGWRPDPDCRPHLAGADLDGIVWPGQDLARVNLSRAELRDADLSGASLEKANAGRACLRGANLHKANLRHWTATDADLGRASLSGVTGEIRQASRADLSGAFLIDADLWRADLDRRPDRRGRLHRGEPRRGVPQGAVVADGPVRRRPLRRRRPVELRPRRHGADQRRLPRRESPAAPCSPARGCRPRISSARISATPGWRRSTGRARTCATPTSAAPTSTWARRAAGCSIARSPARGAEPGSTPTTSSTGTSSRPRRSARPTSAAPTCAGPTSGMWTSTWSTSASARYTADQAEHLRRCRAILD